VRKGNNNFIGLIQLELGYAESADISIEEALALYDKYVKEALELMLDSFGHQRVARQTFDLLGTVYFH